MYWLKSKDTKILDSPETFDGGDISVILIILIYLLEGLNEITEIVGVTEMRLSRFR
jgi:hypothetical protein